MLDIMPERMSDRMSGRMPEKCQIDCQTECQIECQRESQIECQKECQIECQKECQIECQIECQKESQKECQIECQNICQIECQSICQRECQIDCQEEEEEKTTLMKYQSCPLLLFPANSCCQKESKNLYHTICQIRSHGGDHSKKVIFSGLCFVGCFDTVSYIFSISLTAHHTGYMPPNTLRRASRSCWSVMQRRDGSMIFFWLHEGTRSRLESNCFRIICMRMHDRDMIYI